MKVNSAGIFFNFSIFDNPVPGVLVTNTPEGQAIQIAHEMAHVARRNGSSLIAYDGPEIGRFGPMISVINTTRVINNCLPAIRSALTNRVVRQPYPGRTWWATPYSF
jgi:hypothetical protein